MSLFYTLACVCKWRSVFSPTARALCGFCPVINHTLSVDDVNDEYGCIFFAGGHGTLWDFPENQKIQQLTKDISETMEIWIAFLPIIMIFLTLFVFKMSVVKAGGISILTAAIIARNSFKSSTK